MNILKIKHGYGFFSDSTVTLASIVEYYNKYKHLPEIDRSQIYCKYKETKDAEEFFNYRLNEAAIGSVYPFTKYSDLVLNEQIDIDESKPNIIASPLYLDLWGKEILSFCKFKDIYFSNLEFVVKKYFSPSKEVLEIKNKLEENYNLNLKKTIGVYYRGTDKRLEGGLPSYETYFNKIREILYNNPDYSLILQSDEQEFLDASKSIFTDAIIFKEDYLKGSNKSELCWFHEHKNVNLNQIFFAIVLILSECKKIIMNTSNVSLWACLYRGYAEGIHQYLENNPKIDNVVDYPIDNPFYDSMRDDWV